LIRPLAAPDAFTNILKRDDAVIVTAQPSEGFEVVGLIHRHQVARELLVELQQMRPPRAVVTVAAAKQRRNLAHTALARNLGSRRPILLAAELRIGAVLQKELYDLQGYVLVLRQPEQRRG